MTSRSGFAFVLLTAAAVPICAQTAVFRADARLVVVPVAVQGRRGEMVTDLDQRAFTVYENGTRQPIALFLRDDVPVSIGIVLDNSGSMRRRRGTVEAAARAFARASNPSDEVFVVNFADTPRIDVPFTNDIAVIEAGMLRLDPIGGTALRDALGVASRYLAQHATRDRKALLVITDGDDNASTLSSEGLREQVDRAGVAVYAIGLPHQDPAGARRGRRALMGLTIRTGGTALLAPTLDDVEPTAVRLAHEIRRLYTLAYNPLNPALDGTYRKIRVVVRNAAPVTVRCREGYFATAVSSPPGRQ